jgi:hypothetical protein
MAATVETVKQLPTSLPVNPSGSVVDCPPLAERDRYAKLLNGFRIARLYVSLCLVFSSCMAIWGLKTQETVGEERKYANLQAGSYIPLRARKTVCRNPMFIRLSDFHRRS